MCIRDSPEPAAKRRRQGQPCRWPDQQCALAESSAYTAMYGARIPMHAQNDEESADDCFFDNPQCSTRAVPELVDTVSAHFSCRECTHRLPPSAHHQTLSCCGHGGHVFVDMQEVPANERSRFPVRNVDEALSLCLQQSHLAAPCHQAASDPSRLAFENSASDLPPST